MSITPEALKLAALIPLTVAVTYNDVRYRRIPNLLVLTALIAGFAINISFAGWHGLGNSLVGFAFGFVPMLLKEFPGFGVFSGSEPSVRFSAAP